MDFLEKILAEKVLEVEKMPLEMLQPQPQRPSFKAYVKAHPENVQVIGEVKRASPSKGDINVDVDILAQAQAYQKAGVAAISVLTDPVFFKGTIADLKQIAAVVEVPILCKDFIIDQKQLIRAKNAGASLVLLIVAALSEEKLRELYQQALDLDLEVLVETHDQEELAVALTLSEAIIGVNNRNLKTFEVSLSTSVALGNTAHQQIFVSESGFKTSEDVKQISDNYQAVLVGETLMRVQNPQAKVQELQVARKGVQV